MKNALNNSIKFLARHLGYVIVIVLIAGIGVVSASSFDWAKTGDPHFSPVN